MLDREFQVVVINILIGLGKRVERSFKKTEKTKKNQPEMRNSIMDKNHPRWR